MLFNMLLTIEKEQKSSTLKQLYTGYAQSVCTSALKVCHASWIFASQKDQNDCNQTHKF
jgi:hypothetical protein